MNNRLFYTFGLIVLVMVVFAASSTEAASGVGPYYETPSWDEKLACTTTTNCPRFEVLTNWNKEAVLDKETGLVWEQSPSASVLMWDLAQTHCNQLIKGGRLGWRLPTLQELASLIDPAGTKPPYLPAGHPFQNISTFYWSATTYSGNTSTAWEVDFSGPGVSKGYDKLKGDYCWCVRGGQGVDPQ